jgi:hypothetical protein
MRLRPLLWRALAAGSALLLMGHSPYRQWVVFRETHLIVAAADDTPGAFTVSESVAYRLAARVPGSRAMPARARTALDVIRLVRSRQVPLGLLLVDDAADAMLARAMFAREEPLPLRALLALGPYLLVALQDFPAAKAREIAGALGDPPPEAVPPQGGPEASPVPFHPGVLDAPEGNAPGGG